MSFTKNKNNENGDKNLPVVVINGGTLDKNIIYLKTDDHTNHIIQEVPIKQVDLPRSSEGVFEQIPNAKTRVVYIAGPSGSGKSTYAAGYIKKYLKQHKDAPLIVFSRLEEDKVIDDLKGKRIIVDRSLVDDPIEIEDIDPHTIILFDDCETVRDKDVLTALITIKAQVMELGRHTDIQIVITSHLISGNNKNDSRTILNEMQSLTIFPSAGSAYQINYALKTYFGLSVKQIKKIMNMKTRWVTIIKTYPQIVLSSNEIIFVSML
jgi:hypothetical protein